MIRLCKENIFGLPETPLSPSNIHKSLASDERTCSNWPLPGSRGSRGQPMKSGRQGVLAGGNWIIDQVKLIDVYPQREQLANIRSQVAYGTGGAPYNVLIDPAKAGACLPLFAAGLVGKDTFGEQILADCKKNKIDTKFLKTSNVADTSYTDVMTEQNGGRRTFFHYRGANALWRGEDLDFKRPKAKIFHLGYLLLLVALGELV